MASTILRHPESALRALRGYELENKADTLDFFKWYPTLIPLLTEIRTAIPRFFGDEAVTLEISRDPEWPEDVQMVANIQTNFPRGPLIDSSASIGSGGSESGRMWTRRSW